MSIMQTANYRVETYQDEELPTHQYKVTGPALNPGDKHGWIMPYEMVIVYQTLSDATQIMQDNQRSYDKITAYEKTMKDKDWSERWAKYAQFMDSMKEAEVVLETHHANGVIKKRTTRHFHKGKAYLTTRFYSSSGVFFDFVDKPE